MQRTQLVAAMSEHYLSQSSNLYAIAESLPGRHLLCSLEYTASLLHENTHNGRQPTSGPHSAQRRCQRRCHHSLSTRPGNPASAQE